MLYISADVVDRHLHQRLPCVCFVRQLGLEFLGAAHQTRAALHPWFPLPLLVLSFLIFHMNKWKS